MLSVQAQFNTHLLCGGDSVYSKDYEANILLSVSQQANLVSSRIGPGLAADVWRHSFMLGGPLAWFNRGNISS